MTTYKLTAKSAPALTKEQRSEMTELAMETGADVHFLMRRAIDQFLKGEAPEWRKGAKAADALLNTAIAELSPARPRRKPRLKMRSGSVLNLIRYLDEEFSA